MSNGFINFQPAQPDSLNEMLDFINPLQTPAPNPKVNDNLIDDLLGEPTLTAAPTQPQPVVTNTATSNDLDIFFNTNSNQINGTSSQTATSKKTPSATNSFTIYEKNNLRVKFTIDRKDGANTYIMMDAFNNNSLLQINEFKFEAAVPKTFQFAYVSRINSNTINPNTSISQLIQVTNPRKVIK